MKPGRIAVLILILILILAGCGAPHPRGKATDQTRPLAPFTSLVLRGVGNLVFDPSLAPGQLALHCDEALVGLVTSEVHQGTLVLDQEPRVDFGPQGIEFRIAPGKNLEEVSLQGWGTLTSTTDLTFDSLKIEQKGLGKVSLMLTCRHLELHQGGTGPLDVRGRADTLGIVAQGPGDVGAEDLLAPIAEVQHQGVGTVRVAGLHILRVHVGGLGKLICLGTPDLSDIDEKSRPSVSFVPRSLLPGVPRSIINNSLP